MSRLIIVSFVYSAQLSPARLISSHLISYPFFSLIEVAFKMIFTFRFLFLDFLVSEGGTVLGSYIHTYMH